VSHTYGIASAARTDVGSGSGIDDLHTGTLLAWTRTSDSTPSTRATLWAKNDAGFRASMSTVGGLWFLQARGSSNLHIEALLSNFAAFGTAKWCRVACVWDSAAGDSSQILYVGDESTAPAAPSSYSLQQVGAGAFTGDAAANGLIGNETTFNKGWGDDIHSFALFNVALTPTQIDALTIEMAHESDPATWSVTPVAVWYLSGTGTQTDQTGNGNDGTPTSVTDLAAAPSVPATGTGTPGIGVGLSATGTAPAAGTASPAMPIGLGATGTVLVHGSSAPAIMVGLTAAGGAGGVTGVGTPAIALEVAGTGAVLAAGAGTPAIALGLAATATAPSAGTAAPLLAVGLAATGTTTGAAYGTGTPAISLGLTGTGVVVATGTGAPAVPIGLAGAAVAAISGSAAPAVLVGLAATGAVAIVGVGSLPIALSLTATGVTATFTLSLLSATVPTLELRSATVASLELRDASLP